MLQMLSGKISAFCFRIFTGIPLILIALSVPSFFVSLNISTLPHENRNIHPLPEADLGLLQHSRGSAL